MLKIRAKKVENSLPMQLTCSFLCSQIAVRFVDHEAPDLKPPPAVNLSSLISHQSQKENFGQHGMDGFRGLDYNGRPNIRLFIQMGPYPLAIAYDDQV